jgi:hypothetical protein
LPVSSALRQRSNAVVTPAMLVPARSIADRLATTVARAGSFEQKQQAIQAFRLTAEEKAQASVLGFRTISIEVGGGGNSQYLVGGSLSQGVAFSLTAFEARVITSGGFSLGVPGAAADIRVGFWTSPVDRLASWSMGVNGSVPTPLNVLAGVGVFWSFDIPPRFDGFNIGISFAKPSPGGDAGLAWTEYTGQIINTAEDAGRILTFQGTKHGKELGQACAVGADCKGYLLPVGSPNAGVACCSGKCQRTKKDYVGVSWCPDVCKKGLFDAPGSC